MEKEEELGIPTGEPWGLWDHGKWIGDENGPKIYRTRIINGHIVEGKMIAVLAAGVVSKMLNTFVQAREYSCPNPVKVDEVEGIMTSTEALKQLEEGL